MVAAQKRAGGDGITFPGYASEHLKPDVSERQQLTAFILPEAIRHSLTPVITVHAHSLTTATRSVKESVSVDAGVVSILLPYSSPSSSVTSSKISGLVELRPTP